LAGEVQFAIKMNSRIGALRENFAQTLLKLLGTFVYLDFALIRKSDDVG
jgi:hypothetical protein